MSASSAIFTRINLRRSTALRVSESICREDPPERQLVIRARDSRSRDSLLVDWVVCVCAATTRPSDWSDDAVSSSKGSRQLMMDPRGRPVEWDRAVTSLKN
jgi:hypothetical protein